LCYGSLEKFIAAFNAGIEWPAGQRVFQGMVAGINIGWIVEIILLFGGPATDLRPDGIIMHKRSGRPDTEQRCGTIVAAPSIRRIGIFWIGRTLLHCLRTIFRPYMPGHVIAVQRPGPICANAAYGQQRPVIAQEINSHAIGILGMEINVAEAAIGIWRLAGMTTGAVISKYLLAKFHGAGAKFLVELLGRSSLLFRPRAA